ncbi:peptidase [Streptomyces sp. NPDC101181]|uniref:peptidase n=1 Tax=Streptomyces sp. NPDC101181 TaxID=3366125 RepID=UPI003828E135
MPRLSPRTALRRAAGTFAAAGLLAAAGLTGAAAPVQAAAPVFTLGGPADTALHPHPSPQDGEPRPATLGITLHNPHENDGGDGGDENAGYEGAYTLTFDLSGVAGVADVSTDDADCEVTGAEAVCEERDIRPGLQGSSELLLTAAEGSAEGDTGTIKVTGRAEGATFTPFTARVTVGGPDLVMEELPLRTETKVGDRQQAPVTFTNRGTRAADGVLLGLVHSRGIDIPQRYSNCEYTEDASMPGTGWTTALCSVPGSFEPGGTYTLATPLTLETTTRALNDLFVYRIHEDSADQRTALRADAPFERGTGGVLTAVPAKDRADTTTAGKRRAAAGGGDLEPGDNQHEADFRTKNTADFVAYGDEVTGAEGSTVTATIGFRNEGPAWVGHIRSGETVATLDFTVPPGTTVTAKPDRCRAVTAGGGHREDQKSPAPRYFCNTSTTVKDRGGLDLPFGLRVDESRIGASGKVTIRSPWLVDPALPFDPEPGNNTAWLVLNGEGGGSGGPSDGSDGGSGEPSTPSAPDPDESAPATPGPSASDASATSGGGPAATAGGSGGGGLAATGSVALIASGAAVAALVAGLVLFVAGRRRAAWPTV